jgi:oligosaccharyltransferase complex subunit alpha (ribophorin I)
VAEEYTLRVILPEFSNDITYNIPFQIDGEYREKVFSTFDVYGRPTIVFQKSNVFDHHSENFTLEYNYNPNNHFIKPAIVTATIMVFFTLLILVNRFNLKSLN